MNKVSLKTRFVWLWVLKYSDGSSWFGTCPKWASQTLPADATMTRTRVKFIGDFIPCNFPRCNDTHARLSAPTES